MDVVSPSKLKQISLVSRRCPPCCGLCPKEAWNLSQTHPSQENQASCAGSGGACGEHLPSRFHLVAKTAPDPTSAPPQLLSSEVRVYVPSFILQAFRGFVNSLTCHREKEKFLDVQVTVPEGKKENVSTSLLLQ
ncbi:unnamed protein product [Pleuronectes platessa]|uniref:Uncharacterized protein n=1 Tax=Pleuronectes platessa TaxID=8262 RepID=A0A9N7W5E3_PLEPL|nr:unnamed protein product [Pleuronectes platessa]